MLGVPGLQCALVGVQARIARQQGRMNIKQASGVVLHEGGRQDTHEPGQHQRVGGTGIERRDHRLVERLAAGVVAVVDLEGIEPVLAGTFQTAGIRTIAEHADDAGGQGARLNGVDQGLKVGAAATDQHGKTVCHALLPSMTTSGSPS